MGPQIEQNVFGLFGKRRICVGTGTPNGPNGTALLHMAPNDVSQGNYSEYP